MKYCFLFSTLFLNTIGILAQHTAPEKMHFIAPANNPWDLNKYIWSQTHPALSKGDKSILDFDAIENWMKVGPDEDLSISQDGKYFSYTMQHGLWRSKRDTVIVQSADNSWRRSFAGANPGFFSGDSKQYIFQDKEVLCFLQVGSDQLRCVKAIASYQQPNNSKGEWLAYQLKSSDATLVLEHLSTGTEKRFNGIAGYSFDNSGEWLACQLSNEAKELLIYNLAANKTQTFQSVADYSFSAGGKALVLKTTTKTNNGTITAMQYVSLPEGAMQTIWSTADSNINVSSYGLDGNGKQVLFMLQEALPGKTHQPNHSIWYYRAGMDKAVLRVNNQTEGINPGLSILGVSTFTNNGRYIQFSLQPQLNLLQSGADAAQVDVWSYKDSILQSTQPYLLKQNKTYRAVINLETGKVIQLENEYEKMHITVNGDFALIIRSGKTIHGDRFWEKDYRKDSNWVVSLKDGSRQLLPTRGGGFMPTLWFSPGGKYLVYFDLERQCHYFSYNLHTGQVVNISAGIPAWQLAKEDHLLRPWLQPDKASKPPFPAGLAAWLENEEGLLVYDNYDIWQLDLTGKKPAVNVTNGHGRTHKILFSLMGKDRGPYATNQVLAEKDTVLLRAFNTQNKYSGFYRKALGTAGNPALLSIGPYFFQAFEGRSAFVDGMLPLKATNAQTWIVKRQTATEAPNFFITSDFKNYTPLTNLQPQKGYNWLTTELHSFKQLDGTLSQGVLYKPENFDPVQKYPVIIAFYSNRADQPYQYPTPEYVMMPDISSHPAWMVSHGYLVFTPDIYFTRGQWGPSTMNTIDGAARYLSQLPFVDAKRLGACGHSNSGRFGYYLLTHSKSFAAMSLGSGFGGTNVLSLALSITAPDRPGKESSSLEWAESGALGSGLGNLWQNKQSWLDHTAVLNADKTTSPLLLFHNKPDTDDVMQAVQLFISLRRLGKKTWWLQYDESHHITIPFRDSKDFTIRYTQFFDHYLKGAPPPRWMTEGIPAGLKGIESRFELDQAGNCGKDCPVCKVHKSGK